jgi:hypothetical protein
MYDNSGETDKEVLLQAALLLSFWHSEKDSHSQPWYWSGEFNKLASLPRTLTRYVKALQSTGVKS